MRFVNRTEEMRLLSKYFNLSRKKLVTLAIYGLRRVGKTRLVREFCRDKDYIYFFVSADKPSKSLLREFEIELKSRGLPSYLRLINWRDFIKALFDFLEGYIIIIDEFQNFARIAPEFFSYLQREIDENEDKNLMLVIIGSSIGMMKNIFTNRKRPLYGRVKNLIHLKPFNFIDTIELAVEAGVNNLQKILELYTILGGFPRYWEAIQELELSSKSTLDIINELFVSKYAPFIREGFYLIGEERKSYLAILEAISLGLRKLSDIASYLNIPETQLSGPISDLVQNLEVVVRERPIFAPRRSKLSIYRIAMPALRFWFRFIYRNWSLIELGEFKLVSSRVRSGIIELIAEGFEDVSRELIVKYLRERNEEIRAIGRWWRKRIEIDIVVSCTNNNYAFEVKWSNLNKKESINLLYSLKEKTKYIERKIDRIGIIARKISNKEELRDLGFIALDINDLKSIIERKKKIDLNTI